MIIEFYGLKVSFLSSFITLFVYRKLTMNKCKSYEIKNVMRFK